MINSVEARVPFCDYRLVERMAGVQSNFKLKDGIVKYPLRNLFKEIVPDEIIKREKIGFPVPLNKINFGIKSGLSVMDNWLHFNLLSLGISKEYLQELKIG